MAWFLWRAASEAYHVLLARDLLKQVSAGELMRAAFPRVSEALSVRELADAFAHGLKSPVLVMDLRGAAVGMIALEKLVKLHRSQWEMLRVRQVMEPLVCDAFVAPDAPALNALRIINTHEAEHVPVMQDGQMVGVIGRVELAGYLQRQGE